MDFVRSDYLKGIDDQVRGIAIHQIPAIGLKLVAHRCRKACRTYHADLFVTSDIDPQQLVEPDEMIHVHMGNEDVSYTQQVSRAERCEIAEIEQQYLRPVKSLNEQRRVAEADVYQRGMQSRTQGYLFVRPSRLGSHPPAASGARTRVGEGKRGSG